MGSKGWNSWFGLNVKAERGKQIDRFQAQLIFWGLFNLMSFSLGRISQEYKLNIRFDTLVNLIIGQANATKLFLTLLFGLISFSITYILSQIARKRRPDHKSQERWKEQLKIMSAPAYSLAAIVCTSYILAPIVVDENRAFFVIIGVFFYFFGIWLSVCVGTALNRTTFRFNSQRAVWRWFKLEWKRVFGRPAVGVPKL